MLRKVAGITYYVKPRTPHAPLDVRDGALLHAKARRGDALDGTLFGVGGTQA
jgi:hypothetical protein